MTGQQVYFRCTDKEGKETFTSHRCWDKERFVKGTHERMLKEGGKAEQITEDDYLNATRRKHV